MKAIHPLQGRANRSRQWRYDQKNQLRTNTGLIGSRGEKVWNGSSATQRGINQTDRRAADQATIPQLERRIVAPKWRIPDSTKNVEQIKSMVSIARAISAQKRYEEINGGGRGTMTGKKGKRPAARSKISMKKVGMKARRLPRKAPAHRAKATRTKNHRWRSLCCRFHALAQEQGSGISRGRIAAGLIESKSPPVVSQRVGETEKISTGSSTTLNAAEQLILFFDGADAVSCSANIGPPSDGASHYANARSIHHLLQRIDDPATTAW